MDNYDNKIEVINSKVNEDSKEEKINADIETEDEKGNFETRLQSKKGLLGILGVFIYRRRYLLWQLQNMKI